MAYCIGATVVSGKPVVAVEGDSAFGFMEWRSRLSAVTICRSAVREANDKPPIRRLHDRSGTPF